MIEIEEEMMVIKFKSDIKKFRQMKQKLKEDQKNLFEYLREKYPDIMVHPVKKCVFEIFLYMEE